MIRHARMALSSLAAAHDDIVALKHGISGRVEVGAVLTPAVSLLPQAIVRARTSPHRFGSASPATTRPCSTTCAVGARLRHRPPAFHA